MVEPPSWNSAYEGSPPWDEQVMLAARHGAVAMGVDIAELAIERAQAKAEERGISATFQVADVLHLDQLGRLFDVITDSGVFHVFDDEQRPVYVNSLRSALRRGGMYYMMCFSDRQPGDWGPRRVSQAELRAAFVDGWAIGSIEPVKFAVAIDVNGAQAWLATIEHL